MEDQTTVEPTTADEATQTIHEIYAAMPKDGSPPEPPEVEEDAEIPPEGDAGVPPNEEPPEGDELTQPEDDSSEPVDARIAAAIADLPDNVKAPIAKLLAEQKKGVEKIVAQTQEERDWAAGWKNGLTNKATAKDAINVLLGEVEKVTGYTREELIGVPASASQPELDPKKLTEWANFKDSEGEPVYSSRKEMELAVQLHEVRQAQKTQSDESRKFFEELRAKEASAKAETETSNWLTGVAPKIIAEVNHQLNGWVVTKDMVGVALGSNRPTSKTECVALIKAKFADEYIAHSLAARATPAKKREMVTSGGAKGIHIDLPSNPEDITAHHVYAQMKAERRTG